MVLDHIADGADLFVKSTTSLHTEALRLCDLHIVHKIAIPNWLEEGVCKAKVQQILNSLFSQVVIDAIHRRFGEDFMQRRIQRLSRGEVAAKRFLHYNPRLVPAPRVAQTLDYCRENNGWNRKIV